MAIDPTVNKKKTNKVTKEQLGATGEGVKANLNGVKDASGTGAKSSFASSFLNNLGDVGAPQASQGSRELVAKELKGTEERLGALKKGIVDPTVKALTSKPESQAEIDAATAPKVTPIEQRKGITGTSLEPVVSTLPSGGFRTNTYANGANSVTFNNKTLSDNQVSSLDKTLEYNRRPDVIAGFAKNAALSQARYDEYFKGKEKEGLTQRLDAELGRRFPNPTVIKNLQDRLELGDKSKETAPSLKDLNDVNKDKAKLQLDVQKDQESRNKAFFSSLQTTNGATAKTPAQIAALGEGLGADYDLDSALSFAEADKELIDGVRGATDIESYKAALGKLGIPAKIIERQANRKFQG